jgi:hypothetical protein
MRQQLLFVLAVFLTALVVASNAAAHRTSSVVAFCSAGYYKNVGGKCVHSPSGSPIGATAKCRDGTYSYSKHTSGTCSHYGGVARWIHHP